MRIFFDHQAFSLQSRGGVTTVFFELIRHLNARSDISTDVCLGFSSTSANFEEILSLRSRVIHPGRALVQQRVLNYLANDALSAAIAPFLGKYDIYHSTLYRFLPTVRAKFRVATHHDCVPEVHPELFPDSSRIMKFKRQMFREADLILCVSAASRSDLLRFYDVVPEKAVVVHNGISQMRRVAQGEAELRAVISGDFFLYVGARYSYKNFDGLLRAYSDSKLKEAYSLLVLGGGPPTAKETDLISKLDLARKIRFVPAASNTLLAEAYAQSKLLVYPSLYEGFGMPPLEAASAGCVSLVAANPATLEICRDGVFYFEPADREDFSRMLWKAATDEPERAVRVERAARLLQDYTWENCSRNTLAAYRRLQ
jgi:glycosyltransferase involved in cell wall biosynthesis